MDQARWQQVKEILNAAIQRPPQERAAFLSDACSYDETLFREVESLLDSYESEFLEQPAVGEFVETRARSQLQLTAGQLINHYRIVSLLAVSGMGEVYLAEDTRLARKVALKFLPADVSLDQNRERRFEREAKAASALNHPNILVIHEIGESENAHYIVSEFIEGKTLREVCKQSQMSLDEVLDVSIQIADALSAAHVASLVHRDIKPENVMVRPDGYVKVLDFGLAKFVQQKNTSLLGFEESTAQQGQTEKGLILGTVNYMSPEQAKGEELDGRTDIFSLGAVVYEMLAGRTPFAGDSRTETIANLINAEPPPLSRFVSNVSDEVQRIVSKTLRKDKAERYQTMSDLLAVLKALRENQKWEVKLERSPSPKHRATAVLRATTADVNNQTSARPNSFSQRLKRNKSLAALALATVLISAIGLGYYFFYAGKNVSSAAGSKSIAVLPLQPIDTNTRDEIYEIGIADSLIHKLSSMKRLVVRPLSATRKYADTRQDPLAAGREQRVDYVLASNYQLANGKIRVMAQLINVASGQIEETHESENDTSDVFAMQDAIAGEVGNILLARFATTSSSSAAKRGTTNEEAYRLYLQGMYLANNRNPADAKKAVEILEQAVRLDPNYAQAWAGKAYAHRTVGNFRSGETHEAYQESIEAINKALALDGNLADAYSTLCENKMYYEYDLEGAEWSCKRALELNSDSSQGHEIFSRYLMSRGRFDEAIAEIKTAIDLEPTSRFSQRNYGVALFYARRYPEAAAQFKRVIAMDANFDTAFWWLSTTLALQGNESEAFEWLMKLLLLRKVDKETTQAFKTAFQISGWQGLLRERVKRIEKIGEGDIDGAAYNAQIGNKNRAFEYLEKLYQGRVMWIAYLQVDPRLDALRDDPRFEELVKRVGLK